MGLRPRNRLPRLLGSTLAHLLLVAGANALASPADPGRAHPAAEGALSGSRPGAEAGAAGADAALKQLTRLLDVDRFHYYLAQLARTVGKRGRADLAAALLLITPGKVESTTRGDARLVKWEQWDPLARDLLRRLNPGLRFQDSEVAWDYNFFKRKLADAFQLKPPGSAKSGPSAPASDPMPGELPPVDHGLPPEELTLSADDYAAWKTTRAPMWEAHASGRKFTYYLGSSRDFQDSLARENGKILGEITSAGRNYNPLYLIEFPGGRIR